jgi:dTDP-4-amino-4,6-dideoxygalactose transaminase
MASNKPIPVTEPFLPPLEEYVEYLRGIWERNWLTNQGPLVRELEGKIQEYHGIDRPVHCVANGGLGLQIGMKALGVGGEVITTPFTYVATASCPLWEGASIVFADIEPTYLTLDPKAVEAAITPRTEAILATHVFGNPCQVDALQAIADRHGLALLYDASHAFGVRYRDRSILEYGDLSVVSTHATKVFQTVEGGFVVSKDPAVAAKVEWMRRYGHKGFEEYHGVGINAKLSEPHAAMGLAQMPYLPQILERRKAIDQAYRHALAELRPSGLHPTPIPSETDRNFSYFPILVSSDYPLSRDALYNELEANGINGRRYFYPLLSDFPMYREVRSAQSSELPVASDAAARVICLPIQPALADSNQRWIVSHLHP